jgi:hypothetical protein
MAGIDGFMEGIDGIVGMDGVVTFGAVGICAKAGAMAGPTKTPLHSARRASCLRRTV